MNSSIVAGFFIGVGATVIMDLWAIFLRRAFNVVSFNFCLLGRWLGYMPQGIFVHKNIVVATKQPAECLIGWAAHYVIGIVYAFVLVVPVSGAWLSHPTFIPALLVGILTLVFPFLVMQPALGFGIAASKNPNPTQARLKSLMTHVVFGTGLYVSALMFNYLLQLFM